MEESGIEENEAREVYAEAYRRNGKGSAGTSKGKKVTICSPKSHKSKTEICNTNFNSNVKRGRKAVIENAVKEPIAVARCQSEDTIYKNAVTQRERNSSSSEELIDTSDEFLNLNLEGLNVLGDEIAGDDFDQHDDTRGGGCRSYERNDDYRDRRQHRDVPRQLTPEEKFKGGVYRLQQANTA